MAERLAVGLISGTSLDGVDAALVRISGLLNRPRLQLLAFTTVAYPPAIRLRLLKAAGGEALTSEEISDLNFLLGDLFAGAALRVCHQGRVAPERLSVIGSHGQTIFHRGCPPTRRGRGSQRSASGGEGTRGRTIASTLQIAEPAIIAAKAGVPVVADFRTADMAAGGEGAPVVPLVDYLVLRHAKLNTIALNIGGIANVTVIPAGAPAEKVSGFDTGPGNMVMDGLVRHFTRDCQRYDRDGRLAAQGQPIEPMLSHLLSLPFFARHPPKSAGREQFGRAFLEVHFLGRRDGFKHLLRTANELTVRSIAEAFERFVFSQLSVHAGKDRLVISGGGAHNRLLVARLAELLPQLDIRRSDEYGLPADAKEAIAFALLADRTMHGLPGNLPAVTGARRSVVLGKVCRR